MPYLILQHNARYLCDTLYKSARKSFGTVATSIARYERVAAGPLKWLNQKFASSDTSLSRDTLALSHGCLVHCPNSRITPKYLCSVCFSGIVPCNQDRKASILVPMARLRVLSAISIFVKEVPSFWMQHLG